MTSAFGYWLVIRLDENLNYVVKHRSAVLDWLGGRLCNDLLEYVGK